MATCLMVLRDMIVNPIQMKTAGREICHGTKPQDGPHVDHGLIESIIISRPRPRGICIEVPYSEKVNSAVGNGYSFVFCSLALIFHNIMKSDLFDRKGWVSNYAKHDPTQNSSTL